jgi:hypothetical protein
MNEGEEVEPAMIHQIALVGLSIHIASDHEVFLWKIKFVVESNACT